MAISMLKIRRPLGRLIFNMGIAIPGKTVFLIETAPRWRQLVENIWAIIYFSFFCSKLGWCLLPVSKDIIFMNINPDLSKSHQFSCKTVKTPRFLNFSLLVLNCKYYLVWLILIYCQHCQPPLFWLAIFISQLNEIIRMDLILQPR